MLGSSGELGPSLMAAAANRPPGASVLPRDFRCHWSPGQFRLRRPASRATYPYASRKAAHIFAHGHVGAGATGGAASASRVDHSESAALSGQGTVFRRSPTAFLRPVLDERDEPIF